MRKEEEIRIRLENLKLELEKEGEGQLDEYSSADFIQCALDEIAWVLGEEQ